ncbi:MAG: hypothetical protein U5K54_13325 [Cytophagales bacterium]|nr:hypothetical protein [Cytophagales bacterium]
MQNEKSKRKAVIKKLNEHLTDRVHAHTGPAGEKVILELISYNDDVYSAYEYTFSRLRNAGTMQYQEFKLD